jgi:hypothetical protein
MYGTLPNRSDFSCHPVHIEKLRLFMVYEVARLFSFPQEFTQGELDYFQREFERREANKIARVRENNEAGVFDESLNPNGSRSLVIDNKVIELLDDSDEEDKDEEDMKIEN